MNVRSKDDEDLQNIPESEYPNEVKTLARFNRPEKFDDPNTKIMVYSIKGLSLTKGEYADVTDEVKKVVTRASVGETYDKYKDHDYLSRRANISKDDERFDPDFWEAYFKKIDHKPSVNQAIGKSLDGVKQAKGV